VAGFNAEGLVIVGVDIMSISAVNHQGKIGSAGMITYQINF
jgi:hypothetical protein